MLALNKILPSNTNFKHVFSLKSVKKSKNPKNVDTSQKFKIVGKPFWEKSTWKEKEKRKKEE